MAPLLLPRRDLLRGGAALALVGALGPLAACADGDDARLVFLNWQDYIDPAVLGQFTEQEGVTITYETYESNDQLAERLSRAGVTRRRGREGSTFDLIVPSDNLLRQLIDADALTPFDGQVEGIDDLDPALASDSDPDHRVSVPWATGSTGIGYARSAFPDGPPDWSVFLDPSVSDRASLLDETRDAMGAALLEMGEDPNTTDPATIDAAGDRLAAMVGNGVAIDSGTYLDRLASGDLVVAQGYSSDVLQARERNDDLDYTIPDAGGLRWIDSICIPAGAGHVDNAYAFISFALTPEISAANSTYVRVDTANEAARPLLPASLRDDPVVFPPPEVQARLSFTRDLGGEVEDRYAAAFDRAVG